MLKTVFFLMATVALSLAEASSPIIIMIDPGHGGVDTGAVYGPAKESEITLQVAQHLKSLLEKSPDFTPTLTRSQDSALSLQDRVHLAETEKAELFVSIHANASPDKRARGVEFYFQNQLPADEEAMYLANLENQVVKDLPIANGPDINKKTDVLAIVEDLKRQTKMRSSYVLSDRLFKSWNPNGSKNSNVIRQAPFYVISKTNIPSVLVELGFISNPKESQKLIQTRYQKEIAQKIFEGLQAYKEMVDKSEPGRLQ
ncbi:MAG: N-acetylmuramoyl-L-alanine amidase family protein [Pseudobdellovibrionaceae bacterium]